ncbi:MAG: dipeptidyl-peptidase 3 family protein [Pseudomonadota bacterium]
MRFFIYLFLCLSILGFKSVATTHSKGRSKDLDEKLKRLKKVKLDASQNALKPSEKKVLEKLIEASKIIDLIYLRQVWEGNPKLQEALSKNQTPEGKRLFFLFKQNMGPWLRLEHDLPFIPGVPNPKPAGAGYYPENMTKAEFESWLKTLSEKDQISATGFFSVIRRNQEGKLVSIPYSEVYREFLEPASKLLLEASALSENSSLKKFLKQRAEAFLSDNYYDSDVAWMELDSKIEPTIGPYETYEDGLFNYKAAFESFITLRNDAETDALKKFSAHLQDLENNLPLEDKYKNKKIGANAPIRVVDQVFTAGEARRGVATAAFNLPNDEKITQEMGSKRVMLKNVQQAKFESVLLPISKTALSKRSQAEVAFDPFFTHILMHEVVHGLGPHQIKVGGKETTVRMQLTDLYAALEEAKADITGLYAMKYLMTKKVIDPALAKSMYTTFLASCFRSVRFGINEAHGKGIALQFNFLSDEGAFVLEPDGSFSVDFSKIESAVSKLANIILTIQAEGSYEKGKALLDKYAVIRAPMNRILEKLSQVPIDVQPYYPLAGEKDT